MNIIDTTPDGRDIAARNDLLICLELARFGWLTTRMITGLVWPDAAQGQRSAQRRLKSLQQRRHVLHETLSNGVPVYKLSQTGAAFLYEFGHQQVSLRGTRDAKTGNFYHRALANNFLIYGLADQFNTWPEYQVLRGRAPMSWFPFESQKLVPDAIADDTSGTYWIEAENAAKSPHKLRRLYRLSRHLMQDENGWPFDHEGELYAIRGMMFVCPSLARVRAVAKAFDQSNPEDFSSQQTYIVYAPMSISLVWPTQTNAATAYDVARELGYIKSDTGLTEEPQNWTWLHSGAP